MMFSWPSSIQTQACLNSCHALNSLVLIQDVNWIYMQPKPFPIIILPMKMYIKSIIKWKVNTIKYLGVNIPKKLSNIFKENYCPVIKERKIDMDTWAPLTLNLYNQIEITKMTLLPRLLFLFLSLPVDLPMKQFNEWNQLISRFIWKVRSLGYDSKCYSYK